VENEEFRSLEELQAALDEEQAEWQRRGISLNAVQLGALTPLMLDFTTKVQAIANVLVLKGIITEEELAFEFKSIMLNNLRILREQAPEQDKDAIRRQILEGAKVRLNGGKLPWER